MNTNYKCVTSVDGIRNYIGNSRIVAFDFETSPDDPYREEDKAALDPARAHIVGCSFSVKEGTGIYVPIAHRVGINIDGDAFFAFLTAFLMNKTIIKIAHNIAFESSMAYARGIVIQAPVYDTMCASQMSLKSVYEFRKLNESGLKRLAEELFGEPLPSFSSVTDGKHFDELDAQDMETVRYGSADSDFALRLYHRFNEWFDRYLPKHRYIVAEIESPTAVYSGIMKKNGVLVDIELMKEKEQDADAEIKRILEKIHFLIGDIDLGGNCSTNAFKKYLYKDLGLPILKTTTKGKPAIDDAALQMLKGWCAKNRPDLSELFTLVQEYRKWAKLKTTYIDGYLKYVNPVTGRIHPDLMPLGTETGRFACRNPNLQNQVQAGSDPVGIRNFIKAPDGYVLIEADYSQVELRIAAYLSGDAVMQGAYRNDEDIHAITTSAVFGIPYEEAKNKSNPEYKHRRTVAKATMFGILYGIGANGLSRNLRDSIGIKISPEKCESYIDGILKKYRNLAAWQTDAKETARRYGYSQTELGRRRYLPKISSKVYAERSTAERMAMNSPVQGLAADCLKLSMARLVRELKDRPYIRPNMTVHDSLVFEVKKEYADEAVSVIKRCMETPPSLDGFIPLIAEVAVGERYGELE